MQSRFRATALCLWGLLAACSDDKSTEKPAVGGPAGAAPAAAQHADAKTFLQGFLDPAKRASLTAGLQPERKDYDAVFTADVAANVAEKSTPSWAKAPAIGPGEGETEVLVWKATTEELQAHTGSADEFPGGYKTAAAKFKPGVVWYRFKFVKPGETTGSAFDGLVHLDGRWRIFPKPWKALEAK